MKKTLFAAAALVAAFGAQAATVSYEYGQPIVQTTTEINQIGALGLFDSTLGTLTGATLEIFGAATFGMTGTNTAAQAQNANLTAFTSLLWSSSLAAVDALLVNSIDLSFASGIQAYAVGETKAFGPSADADSSSYDLAAILASMQAAGGGSFNLTCESLSGISIQGGGGNIASTQETIAGCGAKIVYTYDAGPPNRVPEPTSLALVGLALAAAGIAARRKA